MVCCADTKQTFRNHFFIPIDKDAILHDTSDFRLSKCYFNIHRECLGTFVLQSLSQEDFFVVVGIYIDILNLVM